MSDYLTDTSSHPPPTTGQYAYNDWKPGAGGFPAVGSSYVDPVFGGTVRRLTDRGTAGPTGDDMYAHHWANSNGTYFYDNNSNSGIFTVRYTIDGSQYKTSLPLANRTDFAWSPINPEIYYYFTGADLHEYHLANATNTVIKTFAATLQGLGGSLNWIDATGDYFLASYVDGGSNKVHLWKKSTNTLYTGTVTPLSAGGWTAMTPDGNYIVTAAGGTAPPHIEHYSFLVDHVGHSISGSFVNFWGLCGDHGSLASCSNGKNYFVTFDCNYDPGIWRVDITLDQSSNNETVQHSQNQKMVPLDFTMKPDGHISAGIIGANKDWALFDHEPVNGTGEVFDGSLPSPWQAYRSEIIVMNLVTLEVRRYAHHRSRVPDNAGDDYWWEPRISCSWDGSVILFDSNFNIPGSPTGYNDMYLIPFSAAAAAESVAVRQIIAGRRPNSMVY